MQLNQIRMLGTLTALRGARPALLIALATLAGPAPAARAQSPPLVGAGKADSPSGRLEIMKKAVATYAVRSAGTAATAYPLRTEPVLRFTNTVGQTFDGAVFVWTGEAGRAEAAVQVFQRRDGMWVQELLSLSTQPLVASSTSAPAWTPSEPGIELRPIPDAPRPAGTPEQRLVQVRGLARRFAVEDNFQRRSWQSLRLLARPLLRYGEANSQPADGALLAYVLTTDPEAFLVLESRTDGTEPRWHYAFARMSTYPLRARLDGREVWSVPYRPSPMARSPSGSFHVRWFVPEP